jgi:hypothetical protein
MTRHGLVHASAAGTPPPARDPRVSMVTIATDSVAACYAKDRLNRAKARRSRLPASNTTLPGDGPANADIGRTSKTP